MLRVLTLLKRQTHQFAKQVVEQENHRVDEDKVSEFQFLDRAKDLINNKMWCGHTVKVLADILIDRENSEELARKVIPIAEKVAQKKEHPGVIIRDQFITMDRMI